MTETCSLCELPTPDPPVTEPDTEGAFCCEGCLEVSKAVETFDDVDAEAVRERGENENTAEPPTDRDEDLAETFLAIDGMHCTTCESFVGLTGESQDGIASVEASYATDTARVQYDPEVIDEARLPAALSGHGYRASYRDVAADSVRDPGSESATRLLVGVILGAMIMPWYVFFLYPSYVGIETGILTADMTTDAGLYIPMGIVALFSAGVVFYTGWPILRGAYVSLRTHRPNMDLLLSIAILAAFAYSTVALVSGNIHLYYDVAVAIVLVVTAGGYYETSVKRQATDRLADLTEAQVREATRRRPDGTTETVAVEDLDPGDEVVVRTGERVPVDGTVLEGTAAIDEQVLTGESLPRIKRPGDDIVGGSIVTDDALVVVVGPDAESTLDRITSMLWAVQSERPGVQRLVDRLATVFVPLVLAIGAGVGVWQLLAGAPVSAAVLAGLTVLVAACPCAMGLATPLAVAGGLRDALRRGMVVTDSTLFESAPDVDTVVFDKTGTLTTGEMTVREVVGDDEAVDLAATVERRSSHPAARAIVDHVGLGTDGSRPVSSSNEGETETPTDGPETDESAIAVQARATGGQAPPTDSMTAFHRHPGEGVSGVVDGRRVVAGTPALVTRETGPLPDRLETAVAEARDRGDLPVVVGIADEPAAVVSVGDREREEWNDVVESFVDREVVVLTGDESAAAERFRNHPAVDRVFAGVPPDGKVATIERLSATATTAMVGDGTNDAPALAGADVGIAIDGTARATEAADVALVNGSLAEVPAVFELAGATRRRIRQNVGWALCYNGVAIPLAAAGLLNPLFAALAMAGSSILVVTNSRRRLL
ncbi:MAG: Cu2+-exporting ATPase [Haloarculaceae archaeon]|jgi:Cu2+-exporting ATPase